MPPFLPPLLLVKLVVTVLFVAAYLASVAFSDRQVLRQSRWQMLLLASFVLSEHPTRNDADTLFADANPRTTERTGMFLTFLGELEALRASNSFAPSNKWAGGFWGHVLLVAAAPAALVAILTMSLSKAGAGDYVTEQSDERRVRINRIALCIFGCAAYAFLSLALFESHRIASIVVLSVCLIGISCGIAAVAITTSEQSRWKLFWSDRLLEILARAYAEKRFEAANEAQLALSDIRRQPAIPLPGQLGVYGVLYTAAQALISWAAPTLGLS